MKGQLLPLGLLAACRAMASNVYWTDDEELFYSTDVYGLFSNFTENTTDLTGDGRGLILDGILFHANAELPSADSSDSADSNGEAGLVRRKVKCPNMGCTDGLQFVSEIQQRELGRNACDMLYTYSRFTNSGSVHLIGHGNACQDSRECYITAGLSFDFRSSPFNEDAVRNKLVNHCHAQVGSLAGYCGAAPGASTCYVGDPDFPDSVSPYGALRLELTTSKKKQTCKQYGAPYCNSIKCNSKNNDCQTL